MRVRAGVCRRTIRSRVRVEPTQEGVSPMRRIIAILLSLLLGGVVLFKIAIEFNVDWKTIMEHYYPIAHREQVGDCILFIDPRTGQTLNKECKSPVVKENEPNATPTKPSVPPEKVSPQIPLPRVSPQSSQPKAPGCPHGCLKGWKQEQDCTCSRIWYPK